MSDTLMFKGAMPDGRSVRVRAGQALKAAAAFWFAVMVAGQAIFVAYIVSFYGGAVAAGDWLRFNQVLPVGYVPGDRVGNAALAAHLAIAALVTLAGPLQLIPALRARFPAFHRWNGRVYVAVSLVTAIAGVYMVWTRHAAGDMTRHWGTTLNAVLIALRAVLAVRHARARRLDLHRRWALRLLLLTLAMGVGIFGASMAMWLPHIS